MSIIQIPPHHYIHVLDQNTNVTRVEIGPLTYILQDNERVLLSPKRMITVPPHHYCVIANPVARDDNGQVLFDQSGQAIRRHGDLGIRLSQDPFPLYPGEEIQEDVTPLQIVELDTELEDFKAEERQKRVAEDEWLFEGPGTHTLRKEVTVPKTIKVCKGGGKNGAAVKIAGTTKTIKVHKGGVDQGTALRIAGTVVGVVAGAVGAVVTAPLVLGAIGFTSAGIAGGSIAAGMMSSAAIANGGGVAAGSLVAILQSAGVVGLSGAASAAVGGAGAAVGGATGATVGWMTKVFGKEKQKRK
ncbi:major vault protein-like isoform X1 [Thunnus maccoyii]|uniref:major vault protein-like isoform X1 n=1 Tax=Thunnus maccoyii TaxID=8240 RepID=UPI001C4AD892|nr:major vault protein-like isoform X1 [Thunnus maccoyii]